MVDIDIINSIDLEPIIQRLIKRKKWTLRKAYEIAKLYRNFLYIGKKYGDKKISPSQQIDDFWHEHVLDTKKYHEDCNKIFGHYLHHNPANESKITPEYKQGFERLQELHKQEFGYEVYDIRYSLKDIITSLMPIKFKKSDSHYHKTHIFLLD